MPLLDEELRFFLDNPKDYYYLPQEDCAVHKNLAAGVAEERRRQATAANCYVRKHAVFLAVQRNIFSRLPQKSAQQRLFCTHEEFAASKELLSLTMSATCSPQSIRNGCLRKNKNTVRPCSQSVVQKRFFHDRLPRSGRQFSVPVHAPLPPSPCKIRALSGAGSPTLHPADQSRDCQPYNGIPHHLHPQAHRDPAALRILHHAVNQVQNIRSKRTGSPSM